MVGVLLGGALLGALAGYALWSAGHQAPDAGTPARPLTAVSPSVPTDPPIVIVADPDEYAPLGTDLSFVRQRVGAGTDRWTYDVPRDWEPADQTQGGIRWTLPGNPDFTYSMRVAVINTLPITAAQAARNRVVNVRTLEGYDQLSLTDQSLVFTYVTDQHLRYQHSYWLTEPGSARTAFEVTVSGRMGDRSGLDALLDHLVTTTTRVG